MTTVLRPKPKQYTIDQFMHTKRMSGISFCPDESEILVTSNLTGITNAYAITIADRTSRQLTFSKSDPIKALSFFPRDHRILYSQDVGGSENRHLWIQEENGRAVSLTNVKRVKTGFCGWSTDGQYLYCSTDERAENRFDLYKVDTRTYEKSMIFRNDEAYLFGPLSPDGRYSTLLKQQTQSESNLYLCDLNDNSIHLLNQDTRRLRYLPFYFAGSYLYYETITEDDALSLYRYDLKSRTHCVVAKLPERVRTMAISESRKYRAVIAEEREHSRIHLHDCITDRSVSLSSLPEGNVTAVAISRSDQLLAFYINGDRQPNELYVYDLRSDVVRKLTNNVNPEIDIEDLVEAESVSFESFDGLRIPCLLWKPHQADAANKVAGLIWVHGGPIGQTRRGYAGAVQYLVNHGYAVLGVNHRGSNGYGRDFLNAADRKQGREPLWDCVEAKRFLAKLDYVDEKRIGIIGGSFGGYMTLAALTFHPEEFAAGVAISGVSNLIRNVEGKLNDPYLRDIFLQKIGDPRTDREMLKAASPAFHAHSITKPLMVAHGAKDPRADKAESDDIVRAVRANGGIVEYLEFDDEAHGFRKRANAIHAYGAILKFLEKHLGTEPLLIPQEAASGGGRC